LEEAQEEAAVARKKWRAQ